jgi:uncharacterized membrane protein
MAKELVFLHVATYDDEAAARTDYAAVKKLHSDGEIGTYDATVVTRDAEGKVHVNKHEKPTQHGAWTGVAVGAVVGILFPPTLIAIAAVGGLAGGLLGHLWGGMSRADMDEIGELLDSGKAALVVIGKSQLTEVLGESVTHATSVNERPIHADSEVVEDAIKNAAMGPSYQSPDEFRASAAPND